MKNKLLFMLTLLLFSTPAHATTLFIDDFEKGEDSQIYKYLTAHGFSVFLVPNPNDNKSKALKVKYVSIFKGSSRIKGFFKLSQKVSEASLSYDVFFDEDFQFVKGGKLHGVGPDLAITGGRKMKPQGWSSRVMWRKNGKIETYLYIQNKKKWNPYGASKTNATFRFQKKRYYSVTLYTKLNSSANQSDGEARIYVDGKLLVTHQNAQFWLDPHQDSKISQFLFTTFHGGATSDWAPKDKNGNHKNVHATFDNFEVSRGLKIREKIK